MKAKEEFNEVLKKRAKSLSKIEDEEKDTEIIMIICFALGDEFYAIEIDYIIEILNNFNITQVPSLPPFIRGVINLRGEIISVTDLKFVFDLGNTNINAETNLIIIKAEGTTTGLLVDYITDIDEIPKDSIEPTLITIEKDKADYIMGEVMIRERMHALIDVAKMIASDELQMTS